MTRLMKFYQRKITLRLETYALLGKNALEIFIGHRLAVSHKDACNTKTEKGLATPLSISWNYKQM